MKPSTILIYVAAMFVVIVAGVMMTSFGLVVTVAIGALFAAFVVWQYGQWTKSKAAAKKADDDHELAMAKEGFYRVGGPYAPVSRQIAAPQPQREPVPTDPRRRLLLELCLMTMRAEGYGATSKRLMTADDAQAYSKENGGYFADRTKWEEASKYGQDLHFLFTQRGGAPDEQGLKIDAGKVGGYTVMDLLSALTRHDQVQAISALPASVK